MSTAKLTGGWRLWQATVAELRAGWKLYVGAALVVSFPARLLGLSPSLASDAGYVAYVTVASLVMNLALLAIARRRYHGEPVSLRLAYYDGTANFVRFALVSAVVAACLIPAGLGIVLFSAGVSTGAAMGEVLVIGALGLLLAIPSLWLFVRYLLATIIAAADDIRPVDSLKRARQLTLGRFWVVAGRLVILGLWLLLVAAIIGAGVAIIGLVIHDASFLGNLYELAVSLVLLPLGVIYLTRLYFELTKSVAK